MSTHKYIDRICCAALAMALLLTLFLLHAEELGVQAVAAQMGYETRLFNTSAVHTLEIVMDDWEGFLETCENEEYAACTVVIDGEAYKNVAIRAKGNTSLSSVSSYGSSRYSFKIEFDHYDSGKTYYGLDKLCLNNIIQDNTYMKDYLVYQMMAEFGVASPLCSYVYITVNGEEWGLYLAVEGVEDAFLDRSYGSSQGELYKPDSSSMGGGRGNGMDFDMERFMDGWGGGETDAADGRLLGGGRDTGDFGGRGGGRGFGGGLGEMPGGGGEAPAGNEPTDGVPADGEAPAGNEPPDGAPADGEAPEDAPGDGFAGEGPGEMPGGEGEAPAGNEPPDGAPADGEAPEDAPGGDFGGGPEEMPSGDMGGGMGGMNSSDVKLQYSDDDPESYPNIFDNAKTDVTEADQARLIETLRLMNEGSVEESVDVEAVLRYFVVHNFVCNGDSYTGSIVHNYYLYEEDGLLSMIPWDYNLAFGGFQSNSSATSVVNEPIDTPVTSGDLSDRPMVAWIFSSEEYTQQYHTLFAEFLQQYFSDGQLEAWVGSIAERIAPYVERDPTKFCTYEEFEAGVSALKAFCALRAESVSGQLDGTIPSTTDGQTQDSSALVDASSVSLADMGSMNAGGGDMGGGRDGGGMGGDLDRGGPESPDDAAAMAANGDGGSEIISAGMAAPADGTPPENSEAIPDMAAPADGAPPENSESMPDMAAPADGTAPENSEAMPDMAAPADGTAPENSEAMPDMAAPAGGTAPENAEAMPDMAAPAGGTAPENAEAMPHMAAPADEAPPENSGVMPGMAAPADETAPENSEAMPDMAVPGGQGEAPQQAQAGGSLWEQEWFLLAVSVLVLLAGLWFAWLWP